MQDHGQDLRFCNRKGLELNQKVVVLGGGTGQGNLLKGLKMYTNQITAIVTVGDDGGGSGTLRLENNVIPPGDIRNCIIALSETDEMMERVLQHRYTSGSLKGQSFGNLYLLALSELLGGFDDALTYMQERFDMKGKVYPASYEKIRLMASLENENSVIGESMIAATCIDQQTQISKLEIIPEETKAADHIVDEIMGADILVLGPGSLYTSIISNLLIPEIKKAVMETKAHKVYVGNLMTEYGETDRLDITDHVRKISEYSGVTPDSVIINVEMPPQTVVDHYRSVNQTILTMSEEQKNAIEAMGIHLVIGEFLKVEEGKYAMHDSHKLSQAVIALSKQN